MRTSIGIRSDAPGRRLIRSSSQIRTCPAHVSGGYRQDCTHYQLVVDGDAITTGVPDSERLHPETAWRDRPTIEKWSELRPLFNVIQKFGEHRNTLAHAGHISSEATSNLEDFLGVVADLLYVLDALEGHEWARQNVSRETKEKLNWKTPGRNRMSAKVRVSTLWSS
jgi:hypothetical protein